MYKIKFNKAKDAWLKETRGVGFEDIILLFENDQIIDDIPHKNPRKYPNQSMFIVNLNQYAYVVPYVKDHKTKTIFLKTIYPSSTYTKKYKLQK